MPGSLRFIGVDVFQRSIDRMVAETDAATRQIVGRAAQAVAAEAKRNARSGQHGRGLPHLPGTGPGPNVMTGRLVRSITGSKARKVGAGTWAATAGAHMFYAGLVERAYPFMREAVTKVRTRVMPELVRQGWTASVTARR